MSALSVHILYGKNNMSHLSLASLKLHRRTGQRPTLNRSPYLALSSSLEYLNRGGLMIKFHTGGNAGDHSGEEGVGGGAGGA